MFRAEVCKPDGPLFSSLHNEKGEANTSNPSSAQVIQVFQWLGLNAVLQRYPDEHRTVLREASLVVALYDLDDAAEGPTSGWQVFPTSRLGVPSWAACMATGSVVGVSQTAVSTVGLAHRTAKDIHRFFAREYIKSAATNVHSGVLPPSATRPTSQHSHHHGGGFLRAPLFRR